MEMSTVEELMVPLSHYPHIPYWFTLRQAIAEMDRAEIVVNDRHSFARLLLVFDDR